MNRRSVLSGIAFGTIWGLSGCIGGGRRTSAADDIGMTASAFVPVEFETRVGEPVVWENTDVNGHTVTAYESSLPPGAAYFASGGFDSEDAAREAFTDSFGGLLQEGDSFQHTFDVPGEYRYFCIPHERGGMQGRVVVTED